MRNFKLHTIVGLLAVTMPIASFAADKKAAEAKPVEAPKAVEAKPAPAAKPGEIKVAYINSAKVLQESPAAQKILQEIQKAEADLNKKIQAKREEIKKAQEAKKSETEIQMMAEKMRVELEPEAKKIQEDAAKKSDELEARLTEVIKTIATQNKYEYVLIKDAVLFGGTDITDEVIKKLN